VEEMMQKYNKTLVSFRGNKREEEHDKSGSSFTGSFDETDPVHGLEY
jgi:hypothetical protein